MKCTPFAGLAVYPNCSTHHFNQTFADGQPQAGAAVFAGGGSVGLSKRLKKFGGLFRCHTDPGITHCKAKGCFIFSFAHKFGRHHDFSVLGEFNRIVGEIEQNLSQTQRITHQGQGCLRGGGEKDFQMLFPRFDRYNVGQIFQNIFQVKLDGLNIELAGFDFGEVQNVIDNSEQRIGPVLDFLHVVFLLGGQIRLEGQIGHANDCVHGGPDFVAHVGQEIAFSFICIIGGLFGFHQFRGAFFHQIFPVVPMFLDFFFGCFQGGFRLLDGAHHLIKRSGQMSEFISGLDFYAMIQPARTGNKIGPLIQFFQGVDNKSLQPHHGQNTEHQKPCTKSQYDEIDRVPDLAVDFMDRDDHC